MPRRRTHEQSAAAAAKLPVLIIEDEPSVMSFVKAALERAGYQVASAASGAEALPILEGSRFSRRCLATCGRRAEWMAPMFMPGS